MFYCGIHYTITYIRYYFMQYYATKRNKEMIRGISDLDYCESKKLLETILERTKSEEEDLHRETNEMMMKILIHEYEKRLKESKHEQTEKEKEIEACNKRMREIEDELFKVADKKNYFEVQLEMLGEKRSI